MKNCELANNQNFFISDHRKYYISQSSVNYILLKTGWQYLLAIENNISISFVIINPKFFEYDFYTQQISCKD